MSILLKGITWDHSRGLAPLQAASQRYSELHEEVQIVWEKRSLQQFADYPIEKLTHLYDLLIIDHPWVGTAAATRCVLPLDQHVPESFLQYLSENSVGPSHESYKYEDHQWALAVDAASPVASYRKDLLEKNKESLPRTWEHLITLAKKGRVAIPGLPIDLLMNFYTFCIARGATPFTGNLVVDAKAGTMALQAMKQLYKFVGSDMFDRNPIKVAEAMTQSDDYWYCPFAYGYSNYSRNGYAKALLHYGDTVTFNDQELRTTLGGTGLAVSAFSANIKTAVQFTQFVCAPKWQAGEYLYSGGQPGYNFGWNDDTVNHYTAGFFRNTLPVIKRSFVRPRYHGYLNFQDEAGQYIQEYLIKDYVYELTVLQKLNGIYQQSLKS